MKDSPRREVVIPLQNIYDGNTSNTLQYYYHDRILDNPANTNKASASSLWLLLKWFSGLVRQPPTIPATKAGAAPTQQMHVSQPPQLLLLPQA
jgi:hypothetical protein